MPDDQQECHSEDTLRCDNRTHPGWIHAKSFEEIEHAIARHGTPLWDTDGDRVFAVYRSRRETLVDYVYKSQTNGSQRREVSGAIPEQVLIPEPGVTQEEITEALASIAAAAKPHPEPESEVDMVKRKWLEDMTGAAEDINNAEARTREFAQRIEVMLQDLLTHTAIQDLRTLETEAHPVVEAVVSDIRALLKEYT